MFGPNEQLVHVLLPGHNDTKLAPKTVNGSEGVFNCTGVDVFTANNEHVIEPAIEPGREAGIRSPTRTGVIDPAGSIIGDQADHRLGGALQMRIDRGPLATKINPL